MSRQLNNNKPIFKNMRSVAFMLLVIVGVCLSLIAFHRKKPATAWKLTWQDEFNYEGLPDANKWNYDIGGDGWGNNELQYYTSKRRVN